MKHLLFYLSSIMSIATIIIVGIGCDNNEYTPPRPAPKPSGTFTMPQPEQIIMYEANPRLYGNSSCLENMRSHLIEIKALGVNVVWLMPICECGVVKSIGSPYCIKDYTKVEPKYGTLGELKTFVNTAHNLGMAVIIDWVANHTSWDNAWIANKEWYTQDSTGNIVAPAGTNWTDVADLNFDNQEMRQAMIEAMKYWIREADIDGYRCDAADWVPADFWQQAITELRTAFPNKEILMLAEGAEKSNFDAGFDMNYAWSYYDALESVFKGESATKIYTTHMQEYAAIPTGAVKLRFTTNHDKTAYNGTPIKIYGGREGSLAALATTTFMGGASMLYGSQEVAQESALSFMTYFENYNWQNDVAYTAEVKRIMAARKDNEVFTYGTLEDYSTSDVVMFSRKLDDAEALVVVNVRNTQAQATAPKALVGATLTDAIKRESCELSETITLRAYEYRILLR